MLCPFTYANGRKCAGNIWQARAYGRHDRFGRVREQDIRKIRLWCDPKGDHAGAVLSYEAKERMEFYPDELQKLGIYTEALGLCDNVIERLRANSA